MKTNSYLFSGTIFFILLSAVFRVEAEPLKIAYNERPPYHYSEKGSPVPKGFVADIVIRAVKNAGIEAEYFSMGSTRIMAEMKGGVPLCSFGWFRNKERLQYANFTHGLWQDEPFVVVVKKEKEKVFRNYRTLADLFRDNELLFGTRMGTSYGDYIDNLRLGAKIRVVEPVNTQSNMVKMLAANRFDFMILLSIEVRPLFQEARIDKNNYAMIGYPDIPKGGKRRIMCSKRVPDEVIQRLNSSISKFVAPEVLE